MRLNMIKLFSKSENAEIFLNEEKILYVLPSTDVGSIIRMDNNSVIAVTNDISYFNDLFFPVKNALKALDTPKITGDIGDPVINIPKKLNDGTTEYNNLPKTPNGNIDKRTNEYKAYIESNTK
jgi:hypothetical protein